MTFAGCVNTEVSTTPEREAEILRLVLAAKWPIGTLATQVGVYYSVVRRVVREVGVPLPEVTR